MFLEYYKLTGQPFGVTPDPRFLYLSPTHREAMASIFYGVTLNRGFSALVARPGMGKTTILFDLLRKLGSTHRTVFLFQSLTGPRGLLRAVLADLGIEDDGKNILRMNAKLNEFLIREAAEGRRLVVVIDEAQNLSEPVLEVVRMLSNFETTREKLLHVILSGQTQLAEKLSAAGFVQLRQRVSIVAGLQPLDLEETRKYIQHRLRIAGHDQNLQLFTDEAIKLIARRAEGIPRTINNLCFNAMMLGCAMQRRKIDEQIMLEVLNDLDFHRFGKPSGEALPAVPAPLRLSPSRVFAAAPYTERSSTGRHLLRRGLMVGAAAGILIWPTIYAGLYAQKSLLHRPATINAGSVSRSGLKEETSRETASKTAGGLNTRSAVSAPSATEALAVSLSSLEPRAPGVSSPVKVNRPEGAPPRKWEGVLISSDQTLFKLCMARYGKYDLDLVAEIVAMNPQISDPDRILAGEVIRMPEISTQTGQGLGRFSRDNNSALHEVNEK